MNYEKMKAWCEQEYEKISRSGKIKRYGSAGCDYLNRSFETGTGKDQEGSSLSDYLDRRVKQIFSFLRENDPHICEGDVLDLGCGNGIFTAEFAKSARHVTAVDILKQAREAAQAYVSSRSLTNVDILPMDITSFDPEKEGWANRFDLVFAGLVPACYTLDAIKKMEVLSRKYCFIEMRISMTDSLIDELFEQAGEKMRGKHSDFPDQFLLLNNILCLDGYLPSVRYKRETFSVVYPNAEEKLSSLIRRFPGIAGSEERISRLRLFLEQKAENGILESRREILSGWILWEVRK